MINRKVGIPDDRERIKTEFFNEEIPDAETVAFRENQLRPNLKGVCLGDTHRMAPVKPPNVELTGAPAPTRGDSSPVCGTSG